MNQNSLIEKIYVEHFGLFVHIGSKFYGLHIETLKEVIQDTFLKVLTNDTKKPTNEPDMRSYLKTIFKNKCIDYLRKPDIFVNCVSNDTNQVTTNQENVADLNSLQEILLFEELLLRKATIERLPAKYREPVRLRLEGEKRKDIARILKIKESSVHNLVYRGLSKYKEIMDKLGTHRKR